MTTDAPPEEPPVDVEAPALTPEDLDPLLKYRKTMDDNIYWACRRMYDEMLARYQHPWTIPLAPPRRLRD